MSDDLTLETSRRIDAPRARVFEAFRDPAQLTRWWGPAGFSSTFETFDFRTGGQWVFVLHGPDGKNYENVSDFVEVVPDERVVIHHVSGHTFDLTITFEDEDVGTRVRWRMAFPTVGARENVEEYVIPANEQNLDRLEAVLA